jgi:hypothetical protein
MELAWGGLEICKVQGETDPENHSPCFWSWRSQVSPEDLTRASIGVLFFPWWVFSHWFFSCKGFNQATSAIRLTRAMHSFLLSVFPLGFWEEFLARHALGTLFTQGGVLWNLFCEWIMNSKMTNEIVKTKWTVEGKEEQCKFMTPWPL